MQHHRRLEISEETQSRRRGLTAPGRGAMHPPDSTTPLRRDDDRSEAGTIYVEILVAMFILAMSLLALVPMLVAASHENGAARDLLFATAAAQDKVEQLKTIDLASLSAGTETISHGSVTYSREWSVQDDAPATGMKTVTVTVTSQRVNTMGGARPVEVSFYRAQ